MNMPWHAIVMVIAYGVFLTLSACAQPSNGLMQEFEAKVPVEGTLTYRSH